MIPAYVNIEKVCERVAALLTVTAHTHIDVRRLSQSKESKFVIFNVNMKPNMTGLERLGREDQSSQTALAALAVGWNTRCCSRKSSFCSDPGPAKVEEDFIEPSSQ